MLQTSGKIEPIGAPGTRLSVTYPRRLSLVLLPKSDFGQWLTRIAGMVRKRGHISLGFSRPEASAVSHHLWGHIRQSAVASRPQASASRPGTCSDGGCQGSSCWAISERLVACYKTVKREEKASVEMGKCVAPSFQMKICISLPK